MQTNSIQVNVKRTITKAEWKAIQSQTRFHARIASQEREPDEEIPTQEEYQKTCFSSRVSALHKQIASEVSAKLLSLKEARLAVFRGKDDAWQVPSVPIKARCEAERVHLEEISGQSPQEQIQSPVMDNQDLSEEAIPMPALA